jgi:TetR/AcrR family transcriptional regulator, cholesterol catabolism regulator
VPARGGRRPAGSGPVSAELIEQEAIRLFSERTYPVIGMRDIGEAVGILPGSLYVHISSKEELLLKIVEQGVQNYLDVVEPVAAQEGPAPERMRTVIHAYFAVLARTKEQTRVAFRQWTYLAPEKHAQIIDLRRRYENAFRAIIRSGVEAGEFRPVRSERVVALGVIGMLSQAMEWFSPTGTLSAAEIAEDLANTVLEGLRS